MYGFTNAVLHTELKKYKEPKFSFLFQMQGTALLMAQEWCSLLSPKVAPQARFLKPVTYLVSYQQRLYRVYFGFYCNL